MKVLQGILAESKSYYIDLEKKIQKRLAALPKGSVKKRKIAGKIYYYLQERKGKKVVHKYLGREEPLALIRQAKEHNLLKRELKKAREALKIIKRSEGRRHGK
jgi:hypothetical protein